MMLPLILYDIPSKLPRKHWSPNPTKPRLVLGYKNLPFETVWVEYPDIAPKLKEIGAAPTKSLDGSEQYTLPVLSDPNTGALVSDSWDIALYLDKTYPEKLIFPNGSTGLINAFETAASALIAPSQQKLVYLRALQVLNERSSEYFRVTREAAFGEKVEEWSPEGPKRDAHWAVLEKTYFESVKRWYDKVEGKWLMGDTFSYADIMFGACLFAFKWILRDDEWKRIAALDDGRWERLLVDFGKECNLSLGAD